MITVDIDGKAHHGVVVAKDTDKGEIWFRMAARGGQGVIQHILPLIDIHVDAPGTVPPLHPDDSPSPDEEIEAMRESHWGHVEKLQKQHDLKVKGLEEEVSGLKAKLAHLEAENNLLLVT
tara:strand:- start:353 stop:712 length:360 start_codon:yes stop_codon:yes gene_type:complete